MTVHRLRDEKQKAIDNNLRRTTVCLPLTAYCLLLTAIWPLNSSILILVSWLPALLAHDRNRSLKLLVALFSDATNGA
jgi:hypothetical protein